MSKPASSIAARCRVLWAALALAPIGSAQCLDWAFGFGSTGNGMSLDVRAFEVFDDGTGPALYATGDFATAGGTTVNQIARWDGTSWSPVGAGFNSMGFDLEVFDDGTGPALYAAGYMTSSGSTPLAFIARWDGSTWTSVGTGLGGASFSLAVHDDGTGLALYAGGAFITADGLPANRIARWDGTTWSAVGDGFDDDVNALVVHDDGSGPKLYAAGGFSMSGATPILRVARWDGTAWSQVGNGIAGYMHTLVSAGSGSGSWLYAGGDFSFSGGTHMNNVARWNGSTWNRVGGTAGIGGGFDSTVYGLALYDDGGGTALYAAGDFTGGEGFLANRIAKWNGTVWSALGSGVSQVGSSPGARVMRAFDDGGGNALFVGGSMDVAGGKAARHIAKWGIPCTAPVIVQQPVDADAEYGQPVTFSIVADATELATYQWRRYGTNVVDGGTSIIEGATTPTLKIHSWSFNDEGVYECVVTNSLGTATSAQARLTVPAGGVTGEPVIVTRIVYPPEPAASTGANYTQTHSSVVADTGDVVFLATTDTTGRVLAHWKNGVDQVLFQAGSQATGLAAGLVYSNGSAFSSFVVASNGQVAFRSDIEGPGVNASNRRGIWYRDATATDLVMREGDPALGFGAGNVIDEVSWPRIGNSGSVAFHGEVYQSGVFQGTGVWAWTRAGGLSSVARTGATAPGTSATFTELSPFVPVNASGAVLVRGTLSTTTGFNYSGTTDTGLWIGQSGSLQLAVKSGDSAPGFPAGTNIENIDPVHVFVNDAGQIAFQAMVAGPGGFHVHAVYRWSSGTLTPIALRGQTAPGDPDGGTFFAPTPLAMNDNGSIVFRSNLLKGCFGCASEGLWIDDGTALTLIYLKTGSNPMPELPANFFLADFQTIAVNNSDHVLVHVQLSRGGGTYAVYGWTLADGVFPIALPGAQFEVETGDYRTCIGSGVSSVIGGSSGHESTSLTDSGFAVLGLGFSNGTSGIFGAQFQNLESLYFPPGEGFCFGDGSLATPCPCVAPNLVPHPSGAPDAGCANSFNLDGAKLVAAGETSPDTLRFTVKIGPSYVGFGFLIKGNAVIPSGFATADGVRCAGGALIRFGAHNASTNGAPLGSWTYPNSVQTLPVSTATAQGPAQSSYYQFFYRNTAPGFCSSGTTNFSNGYRIDWP